MLSASGKSKAAGWNQAGNFGGGVLGAALVLWLVQHTSVGLATAAMVLLPALVAFTVPEAPPAKSAWFRGGAQHSTCFQSSPHRVGTTGMLWTKNPNRLKQALRNQLVMQIKIKVRGRGFFEKALYGPTSWACRQTP
jgi:hypothetical protein